MGIHYLDHATDAFVEVTASSLEEAFLLAGKSVVDTTLDMSSVQEKEKHKVTVTGKDLTYLLFNWLEEMVYQLITEGFAVARISLSITQDKEYKLEAMLHGEPIDLQRHGFKVEIKAPTFHQMKIEQDGKVFMRFLLDL